jgi:hypothetical protein
MGDKMRIGVRFLLVFVLTSAAAGAWAASQTDYNDCDGTNWDARISGCTAVIQDAKETVKNRATAYYKRGIAHEVKGDFARAIDDYNSTLALQHDHSYAAGRRDYVIKMKDHLDRAALGSLDGTWEGELTSTGKDGKPAQAWRRIVISGDSAKVFIQRGGKTEEIKTNAFHVQRHLANAVVLSIDSAIDDEGLWIETWCFVVTLKDPNTLLTEFSRVVNNANLPLSVDHSKFTSTASGELRRM